MAEEKVPSPLGIQDLVCDLLKVKSFLAYYFTCVIRAQRVNTAEVYNQSSQTLYPKPALNKTKKQTKNNNKIPTKTRCKAKERFSCREPLPLNKSCCIQLASAFQASICAAVVL